MEKDDGLKKRFKELANKSYTQNIYTFTDFLGLNEQSLFDEIENEISYVGIEKFGGTSECERKVIKFGKEEELMDILKLTRGCVSPFGIINDVNNVVTLVIDSELKNNKLLFHPNRNTATVSIHFDDLEKFIKSENHNYILM